MSTQDLSLFDKSPVASRLCEATTVVPQAITEALRRLHKATAKPPQPQRSHKGLANAPLRLRSLSPPPFRRGVILEPLRSLHHFNKPPVHPQLPNGRFHSESVILSEQSYGVVLGLKLCKTFSRNHHGATTAVPLSLRQFVK